MNRLTRIPGLRTLRSLARRGRPEGAPKRSNPKPAPASTSTKSFARAYLKLLRELGADPDVVDAFEAVGVSRLQARDLKNVTASVDSHAWRVTNAVRTGRPLDSGLVDYCRASSRGSSFDHQRARTMADSLSARSETAAIGQLCSAVVTYWQGSRVDALKAFESVPDDEAVTYAPIEYADVELLARKSAPAKVVKRLIASGTLEPEDWLTVMGLLHDSEAWEQVSRVADFLRDKDLDSQTLGHLERRVTWAERYSEASSKQAGSENSARSVPTIAVLGYDNPNELRASTDLGDYIESVAALALVARQPDLRFDGEPELVELADELATATRKTSGGTNAPTSVRIVTVNRDATWATPQIASPTWVLSTGVHMNRQFGTEYEFPYHDSLEPLFLSFHLKSYDVLTDDAVKYLKAHGPVGCRDLHTWKLLHQFGIPAFHSGSIVAALAPLARHRATGTSEGRALAVDASGPQGSDKMSHTVPELTQQSATQAMHLALSAVKAYRDAASIHTSQLSAYLTAKALSVPAVFAPSDPLDPQLEGLTVPDFTLLDETPIEPDMEATATLLETVLTPVISSIAQGASIESVRETWGELTSPFVEKALASQSPQGLA